MQLIDFNAYEQNLRMYGGTAGRQEHPFLQDITCVQEHFWNMFVMDALIGNTDRNNSNWGIILRKDESKIIAPVYDNGNCLNNKWDDAKMQEVLEDTRQMEAEAYKARRCILSVDEVYIDENITLRDDLPSGLQQDFEEVQGYYDAGDWLMFDTVFEAVEATVKAYYLAGKISIDDLNRIFEKYGIA